MPRPLLRIGIDAHVLTGKFQGSRTYLLNLLRHLGRIDRRNIYLIYSFDPSATRALLPFENFQHVPLAMHAPIPRLLLYWPWEQWRRRLDLLVTSYFCPLLFPARQIVIVHDLLFETHKQYFSRLAALRFRALVRLSARRARTVIAVSRFTRAEILSRYRLPDTKVRLVSGGIDAVRDESGAIGMFPEPYVLSVGRLEPRKNIAALLRAFPLMQTPNIHLVVVGREDFGAADTAAALRALQANPATAGRVIWRTDLPDAELPAAYAHAAVFAFPSFAEGFGLPILEALAQFTPVVASGHAALRDIGGNLCRYFDANAPDADHVFAELLDQAIAEGLPDTRQACAAHVDSYDWTRSALALLAIINDTPAPATSPAA